MIIKSVRISSIDDTVKVNIIDCCGYRLSVLSKVPQLRKEPFLIIGKRVIPIVMVFEGSLVYVCGVFLIASLT